MRWYFRYDFISILRTYIFDISKFMKLEKSEVKLIILYRCSINYCNIDNLIEKYLY